MNEVREAETDKFLHERLDDSILELEHRTIGALERLRDVIEGLDSSSDPTAKSVRDFISLREVLLRAPSRIQTSCERIEQLVRDIEELLFAMDEKPRPSHECR